MKTIIKLTVSILIGITTLSSCKPKTAKEQFLASMEGKTDAELIQAMNGEVQVYKVYKIVATREDNPYKTVEITRPRVKMGAVLNIIYSEHSIYIEGFDRLNGTYHSGYYASSSGEFSAKFTKRVFGNINDAVVNNGERKHPSEQSKHIELVQTAKTQNEYSEYNIKVTYFLERL